MAAQNHITPETYVHPDDPAFKIKPGESWIVDGLDWSWAFVWYKENPKYPGYCFGSNGTLWSRRKWGRAGGKNGRNPFWSMWKRRYGSDKGIDGRIRVTMAKDTGKGHPVLLHPLLCKTFYGPRPTGMECLHYDGNYLNNRIANLRYGTSQENTDDMKRHGTLSKGCYHTGAILTDEQVLAIRKLLIAGVRPFEIMRELGVNAGQVHPLIVGKRYKDDGWGDLDRAAVEHLFRPGAFQRTKLTERTAGEIKSLLARGAKHRELAQRYGVGRRNINDIANGKIWAWVQPLAGFEEGPSAMEFVAS